MYWILNPIWHCSSQPMILWFFTKKIAEKGKHLLKPHGKLYFEINERFGNEVVRVLSALDFKEIRIIKDLNGKDRIVSGQKSGE
ncbi:hypothetical protein [Algoriphagus boritolerans]|uniref:hypothetical protein n=1 Tax=Algoriphagus boritolerans TaxID=308111 RepID=UPI000B2BEBE0